MVGEAAGAVSRGSPFEPGNGGVSGARLRGGAHTIILAHLSESNNAPELARISAEQAIGDRMTLLCNRILLAQQQVPMEPVEL